MMQFSENTAPSPYPLIPPSTNIIHLPSSKSLTSTASSLSSTSCMEQLLVHCAHAVDRNDSTLAHQILWVLNTIAPPDGDSTQRLTSAFLRSLVSRASKLGSCQLSPLSPINLHKFSLLELASFVDLTPYHRFGYTASNASILDAIEGFPFVHIVDFSTTHCMQIPTLIDALANRVEGPPLVRLTVPITSIPPMLAISYDELGSRLVNFARSRNVMMEFRVVSSSPNDGFETLIQELRVQRLVSEGEALVINCQMLLHYIPLSVRSMFLKNVRGLEPTIVTLVDEDADFTDTDVVGRLRSAFNYLWIPYDAVEAFLPRGSERRRWYEEEIGWKIENVIGCEGVGRVEKSEKRGGWGSRMREVGFRGVGFGEEGVAEVKGMLDEHAAGWGLKKEEDLDLVLTWKGHNVVFASSWVPT